MVQDAVQDDVGVLKRVKSLNVNTQFSIDGVPIDVFQFPERLAGPAEGSPGWKLGAWQ